MGGSDTPGMHILFGRCLVLESGGGLNYNSLSTISILPSLPHPQNLPQYPFEFKSVPSFPSPSPLSTFHLRFVRFVQFIVPTV